jgi:hypothetical protein
MLQREKKCWSTVSEWESNDSKLSRLQVYAYFKLLYSHLFDIGSFSTDDVFCLKLFKVLAVIIYVSLLSKQ